MFHLIYETNFITLPTLLSYIDSEGKGAKEKEKMVNKYGLTILSKIHLGSKSDFSMTDYLPNDKSVRKRFVRGNFRRQRKKFA